MEKREKQKKKLFVGHLENLVQLLIIFVILGSRLTERLLKAIENEVKDFRWNNFLQMFDYSLVKLFALLGQNWHLNGRSRSTLCANQLSFLLHVQKCLSKGTIVSCALYTTHVSKKKLERGKIFFCFSGGFFAPVSNCFFDFLVFVWINSPPIKIGFRVLFRQRTERQKEREGYNEDSEREG